MAVTSFFTEAVRENNIRRVRDMMADSLIRDPLFEEFGEMEAAAKSLSLYEPHDGGVLNQDKAAWDKTYLDSLMIALRSNFSRERVAHVKDVCRKIYGAKIEAIKDERRREAVEREPSPAGDSTAANSLWPVLMAGAAAIILLIGWLLGRRE